MALDDHNDPLRRLQILQRDLIAFTEANLNDLQRLSDQLDASNEDFKKLLERTRKNESSRAVIAPNTTPLPETLTIDDVEYRVAAQFRQDALQVADELDLDEVESAKLCIRALLVGDGGQHNSVLALRAVLRFHEQRQALLDCLRIFIQIGLDPEDDNSHAFREATRQIVQGERGGQDGASAFWRKCIEGLQDIESFLRKISAYKDKLVITGQGLHGEHGEWLVAQRLLLTRQHESMVSILSYLCQAGYAQPEDYRGFLSKAASLDAELDIAIHYMPVLINGAAQFASEHSMLPEVARDLHKLFAAGPGQLQWKHSNLKAAATICWLAEYNARFTGDSIDTNQSQADQTRDEEARTKLCFDSLKDKGFHFMLTAAAFLKPVVWHDPARTALVDFLVESAVVIPSDSPRPSDDFSTLTMREFQMFADAFVTNMPDALRKLKLDEDDWRRNHLSQSTNGGPQTELDLERFMVIIACAYQDDIEAARDFWKDREGNLYGFLRWVSQRLPTPRVAAFCHLLRSIACDDRSANDAHRFLLEDAAMASGKLRKTFAVSWAQIFSELELYASSLKDRPSAPTTDPGQEQGSGERSLTEPETSIMLDAYLGLATHICRASPDARNWLLKDQHLHLGEVMFELARSGTDARVQACCLDLLSALLVDKVPEVRNGIWVLLDSWLSSGGIDAASAQRLPGRPQLPAKQYLQVYANNAEAGVSLVGLLNALVAPATSTSDEHSIDALPFPENLGSPHRHAGIDVYVDFVMDAVFARKVARMSFESDASLGDLLRFQCLEFAFLCLSTFKEDLVLLANITNISVEATMETKSLAAYARLHPFARVMEWLFDKGVLHSLFVVLQQNMDALDDADARSPLAQGILKTLQVFSLAWKLQPTYLDLVKPAIATQASRSPPVSSTWTSFDEVFLTHVEAIASIAQLTASRQVDISLEALGLLQQISSSRKVAETGLVATRQGSRIIGVILPMSTSLTLQLAPNFQLYDWDLDTPNMPDMPDAPLKVVKASAILNLINASLDASNARPSLAHCLLGFNCRERIVEVLPQSAFEDGKSLFHAIATCAAMAPTITHCGNTSWLLSLKRGCLEIVLKLAVAPLTAYIVQPVLRSMDFLAATSKNQVSALADPMWDKKLLEDPNILLNSSGAAVRDFMHVRKAFFDFVAADLRAAAEQGSFSVQEKIVSALLGTIQLPDGGQDPTISAFDLFDFFDVTTTPPFAAQTKLFQENDVSDCTKDDPDTVVAFDIAMAEGALVIRKRELKAKGFIKDLADGEAADNEITAMLASLRSQNCFASIRSARLDALEAWTDLLSLVVTKGGLGPNAIVELALQGLLVVVPKVEKSITEHLEAAALLAKLVLTFTRAVCPASQDSSEQTASVAIERLLSVFRVSLRVISDSGTDHAIRDVAYRTCRAILGSVPNAKATARTSPTASAKQLLQLVQNSGERLLGVITEDAFSGRGVTRVSALLFLDGLVGLFQNLKANTSMLKALTKLNFVPVLIDSSIVNVAAAFGGDDDMAVTLAFIHTALALMLRLCQTTDGTQLVLNSGLFEAIEESKLFSIDPDLGLDIDNPLALSEFYSILAGVLRLITIAVVQKGSQPGTSFLHQHRSTVQAIFKQAARGQAVDVADELSRLILATGFLEDDEAVMGRSMTNGFT